MLSFERELISEESEMENEIREERVNFSNGNLAKLDVSKGENITELYVQGNRLEEIDLSCNKNIKILDCTDNPLIFIKSNVPSDSQERQEKTASSECAEDELILRACQGGTVGLKYSPQEGQRYYAYADEGYKFDGWYDVLGDRLSKEVVWIDAYGTGREIFAMFVKA